MRTLIALLCVGFNSFACDSGPISNKPKSENEEVVASSHTRESCAEEGYRHKTDVELVAMTPAQLIDEEVKERIYHQSSGWYDDYPSSVDKYLDKYGEKLIPLLIGYIKAYDPKVSSQCEEIRFSVASGKVSDIDNNKIRLRATPEGRLTIEALKQGVKRLREAGFDKSDHERNYIFNISALHLEMAKGTNICDEMIRATLEARHKIQMTESEYLEFSNFLTSLDPSYPTWSEVGEYGPPTTLKESKKYHEAYDKFKAKNKR